jgi:hypothetical protein
MFHVKQFIQVHTLTLIAIKESQLRDILKHVNISSLISLTIDIKESNDLSQSMTVIYLRSIFIRSKLRKLILNIKPNRIENIGWPDEIEYLEIGGCIHFDQINQIQDIPRLRTLIIGSCSIENIHKTDLVPFGQLTSFALKNLNMKVDDLEYLLRLMPSLTHLKLIGNGNFLNGHRWEQFIQINLPLLNKFEFFFNENRSDQPNPPDIEWIIESFRTTFWLKLKNWFVTCKYNISSPEFIQLYTIPICMPAIKPKFESTKISVSTLITAIDNDASIMVNGDRITFNFTKLTSNGIEQKVSMNEKCETTNHSLFRTMKKLGLIFNSNRPVGWILFVSMFINLTTITHIGLAGSTILNGDPGIVADIKSLLQQTCNVYSLNICGLLLNRKSCLTADHICSMIPIHVRQLIVSIKNLNEVKIVLQQLEHLSSAKFIFDETPCWNHFHEWFKTNKQNMSYQTDRFSLYVWFKKNNNVQSNDGTVSNKRIKLTDDHHGL